MELTLIPVLILGIALLAGAIRTALKKSSVPYRWICPVCVGVSATWIVLLVLPYLGYTIDPLAPAILMGGSVVGITYQLEKMLGKRSGLLAVKTLLVTLGLVLVYAIFRERWVFAGTAAIGSVGLVVGCVLLAGPVKHGKTGVGSSDKVERLEKQMDDCC